MIKKIVSRYIYDSPIRHTLYLRGKLWHVDFTWNHQRERHPLRAAKRSDAVPLAQIKIKEIIFKTAPVVTLGELAIRYGNMARIEKRSWKSDQSLMIAVLKYFGAGKSLNDIKPVDVQEFKTALSQRVKRRGGILSHASVNRHLALLKTMFNKAIEWEMFNRPNPCCKVKLYIESSKQEYFTQAEIRRLLEAAKQISDTAHPAPVGKSDIQRYFVYILTTAIYTGMRLGEILRMRWADISDGFITIRAETAKSKRSRQVPAVPGLLATLSRLPSINGEYVFPVRQSSDVIAKVWARTKVLAKVKSGARFHNIRHSFCSFLVQAGVDIQTIREIAGHSDLKTTSIYAHSSQTKKLEAVNKINFLK